MDDELMVRIARLEERGYARDDKLKDIGEVLDEVRSDVKQLNETAARGKGAMIAAGLGMSGMGGALGALFQRLWGGE
jgi:hypothetical protein